MSPGLSDQRVFSDWAVSASAFWDSENMTSTAETAAAAADAALAAAEEAAADSAAALRAVLPVVAPACPGALPRPLAAVGVQSWQQQEQAVLPVAAVAHFDAAPALCLSSAACDLCVHLHPDYWKVLPVPDAVMHQRPLCHVCAAAAAAAEFAHHGH